MTLSSSSVAVKGRPTQILTAGDGEPLVFLHGGGIIEGFECFEPLAARFRLIVPLAPGYGATELDPPVNGRDEAAANVRDVLDAVGIQRTALVGHSLGGWLAAAVAAHFPDRIGVLVLGAPYGMDVPEHRGANMMELSPTERLAALTNDPSIFDGRFPSGPDPAFEAARQREMQAVMRVMPGPHDPGLPSLLPQITTPTMLLWGEDDRVNPAGQAAAWQAAVPNASLRTFQRTGHLLFHERPDTVEAVGQFVQEVEIPT